MGKAYTVKTAIVADDQFSSKLKGIADKARSLGSNFAPFGKGVLSDLGRIKGALTSLTGLAAGITLGGIAKGFISANADAESMRLAMTSLIQSADKAAKGPLAKFEDAFEASGRMIELMRKEAVSTPATLDQITDAFNTVAFSGRKAGASFEDISKMAANIATVDMMSGGQGLVARDVSELMMGKAADDIDTAQLKNIAPTISKLVKRGKNREAWAKIIETLAIDEKLRAKVEDSWEGRLSTFKDQLSEIQREAGKPLFAAAKDALTSMSKWIRENPDKVKQMARDFGEGVLKAAIAIKDAFAWIVDNSGTIKDVALALAGVWAAGRVGQLGKGLLGAMGVLRGGGAAGGVVGALGKGGACCCGGGALGGIAGPAGKATGALGQLARVLTGMPVLIEAFRTMLGVAIDSIVNQRPSADWANGHMRRIDERNEFARMFGYAANPLRGDMVVGKDGSPTAATPSRRAPSKWDGVVVEELDEKNLRPEDREALARYTDSPTNKFALEMEVLFKNAEGAAVAAQVNLKKAPPGTKVKGNRGLNAAGTNGGRQ